MLQKLSFRWKLYIIYGSIISGILIVTLSVFWVYNIRLLNKNMENAALDTLELSRGRLEDFLKDKDQRLQFFHTLPEFEQYIKALKEQGDSEGYYVNNPEEAEAIQKIFLSILATEENGSAVSYISEHYNNVYASVLGNYDRTLDNSRLRERIDLERWLEGEKNCYYVFPHEDYWYLGKQMVISVYRPVKDMFQTYGMLIYNVNVEQLNEILKTADSQILILDTQSDIYYSTEGGIEEGTGELLSGMDKNAEEGYLKTEGNYRYYYQQSKMTGWTLIMKQNISGYLQDRKYLTGIVLLALTVGSAAILGVLYVVSRQIANPLLQLKERLEGYKDQELIHIDVMTDNNEITLLGKTIENMVNEIVRQNQRLMDARELAHKAQMSAMEAQLNPHFLYNTLSIIGTYGLEQENMIIPQMCSELSNILRYSVSYSGKEVTLKDELQNITSYLYIMEMRYENMMECIWELEPRVEGAKLPKLVLQPIIENCFKHGFQNQRPIWIVKVRSWEENGEWRVAISNSGVEFNRKRVEAYLEAVRQFDTLGRTEFLYNGTDQKNGFGLRNTILRLHMFYHGKEHFAVYVKDGFTTVEIGGSIL